MTCGIYCIENKISNKKYIGQSRNIEKRIKEHTYNLLKHNHSNPHLNDSFQKYGIENFSFYILSVCEEKDLDKLEKHYIKTCKAKNPSGYNLRDGGEGNSGWKQSEETKKKISESKTNPRLSTRIKNSNAARGKKRKKNATSEYVGVSFDKKNNRWKSQFEYMGKKYWLGRFTAEIDAAKAYNLKAIQICGSETKLNRIEV